MAGVPSLAPELLYRRCAPESLPFETTAELAERVESAGQQRALKALHFGIDLRHPGYNLFVLGKPGSGRHAVVRQLLEGRAEGETNPGDWCYVNNFAEANKPRLLHLPAGRGGALRRDMQRFIAELPQAIAAAFETEEYRSRVEAMREALKDRERIALQTLGQESLEHQVAMVHTPNGIVFAPMKGEEAMTPDEFEQLPETERERLHDLIESYTQRLTKLMQQFPRWRRDTREQVKTFSRETMGLAVGHLIEDLKEGYRDLPEVVAFLDEVMADIADIGEPLGEDGKGDGDGVEGMAGATLTVGRYQVNLFVDNEATHGAPVIYEDNPIYPNLVGRVDHVAHMGTLITNFTFIKPGALHRANGGYLVLDAAKVLLQPYAWEGLKRALRAARLRIESLGQAFGFTGTAQLEPEAFPLDLKVLLVGERRLYYLLKQLDPEFDDLFKIAADFEDELPRDEAGSLEYARFVATLARDADLLPLARTAVARVIEHAARLAGDAERLSGDRRRIADLLREADHHARKAARPAIAPEDVEAALAGQIERADRLRADLHEAILRDLLLISVEGGAIAQVNGLSVVDLAGFRFGHPVRITATARIGDGEVVDIERKAELGGAIHSKGVMILAAYLGARYSPERPMSLSASLVFEQSYGPVEGDSASLAELCALLSALSAVPIRQSLAITGSVNQHGQVQVIGGVNEKIEGFFDICRARGLTGEQGVLIPAGNVKHLMLRADVVEACAEGRFHVHPVASVDEAIETLTGIAAGSPGADGSLPAGSVNQRVEARLAEFSALRKAYTAPPRGSEEEQAADKTQHLSR